MQNNLNEKTVHTDTDTDGRTEADESGFARKWAIVSDWLGSYRPLDLILGCCTLIAALAVIAHAVSSA